MYMRQQLKILTALAVLATAGVMTTTTIYAQTNGMDRRGDRRDDRQGARDEKQECKAGDEKSRPECRQDKRDTKQEGRGDEEKPEQPAEPGNDKT
jgi:hypothetical protein